MLLEQYQEAIKHLMLKDGKFIPEEIIGLGLAGEIGELLEASAEAIKLAQRQDVAGALAAVKLEQKELGDVLWYVTALATSRNINLKDVDLDSAPADFLTTRVLKLVDKIKKDSWHGKKIVDFELRMDLAVIISSMRRYAKVWDAIPSARVLLEDISDLNVEKLKKRYPAGFVEGGGVRS
jgi:NTP pyrophosphatase (non-canonical NTP hydrolase)